MKLRLRQFQAIGDVQIEVKGLTTVTGRSNLGKSALLRGVKAMLYGTPGDYYVRWGCDWTDGVILFDDPTSPLKISWKKVPQDKRKPDSQPYLTINGTKHTKIGRDHASLTRPFGIFDIETSTISLRPQMALQHDPIFLVEANETAAAEAFKMLGRVDVITNAQKAAKQDLKRTEQELQIRKKDRDIAAEKREEVLTAKPERDQFLEMQKEVEAMLRQKAELDEKIALLQELEETQPIQLPKLIETLQKPTQLDAIELLQELSTLDPIVLPERPMDRLTEPFPRPVDMVSDLMEMNTALRLGKEDLDALELTICQKKDERAKLEAELGICPTCRRQLNRPEVHEC